MGLRTALGSKSKPKQVPRPLPEIEGDNFGAFFREYLLAHYLTGFEPEYVNSEQFKHDINEHVFRRTRRFHDHLVPWISNVFDLAGAHVFEIGSGTGASSLAFSPHVEHLYCYEIDQKSTRAAKARLGYFGIENVSFEEELFGPESARIKSGQRPDALFFIAVLEHMTFSEFETTLKTAYECLRPGGIIVIAETPNRLTVTDYHSSWIPFFQWLPRDVQARYFDRSPRQHFAHDVGEVLRTNPTGFDERLTRWGSGVSFHDFEIVLGRSVHDMIIADGWEDEVRPLAPIFKDDELLLDIFNRFEIAAHKAFARSWLYLILQKR